MLHSAASDQGLHSLPLTQQILETPTSDKTDLFKIKDKYGKLLRCLSTYIKKNKTRGPNGPEITHLD